MTPVEVKAVAEALLAAAENNGKWKYEIESPVRDRIHPQQWNVVIYWKTPDGTPLDGPGVIIVDEITGEARFL